MTRILKIEVDLSLSLFADFGPIVHLLISITAQYTRPSLIQTIWSSAHSCFSALAARHWYLIYFCRYTIIFASRQSAALVQTYFYYIYILPICHIADYLLFATIFTHFAHLFKYLLACGQISFSEVYCFCFARAEPRELPHAIIKLSHPFSFADELYLWYISHILHAYIAATFSWFVISLFWLFTSAYERFQIIRLSLECHSALHLAVRSLFICTYLYSWFIAFILSADHIEDTSFSRASLLIFDQTYTTDRCCIAFAVIFAFGIDTTLYMRTHISLRPTTGPTRCYYWLSDV